MKRAAVVGLLMAAGAAEGFSLVSQGPGLRSSTVRTTAGVAGLEMKNGEKRAAVARFFREKILRRKPASAAPVDVDSGAHQASEPEPEVVAATPVVAAVEEVPENPNIKAFRMPPIADELKKEMAVKVEAPKPAKPAPAAPAPAPVAVDETPDVSVSEFSKKFDEIRKQRTMTLTQKLMD
mmetsp:Transcript_34885/g.81428  ORF Transcript_34885/g.81428 Transcript_34885/m.81428 type:complete len:180 (-) Transcript_34885:441-980(-)